jgi:pimeloyl-ACP methyl ester carboxylesterase
MEYTRKYNELKNIFDPGSKKINIPGSDIRIVNIEFFSDSVSDSFLNKNDISVPENVTFSYPVFVPSDAASRKVILLLHGLNERSWVKYLVWAYYLAQNTGSYIILFPISFHINRSPELWKDPRAMFPYLSERKTNYGDVSMSSIANIALSKRLTEDPMRFFNSGYQTTEDIVKLMSQIRDGKHELIPCGSRVNIFAYSIGAFLAQIIMMGNPENLFTETKLFMFCGGSVFSNMHGTSKLIMDSLAYDKVFSFYLYNFEKEIKGKSPVVDFLCSSKLGMAFRSMIDLGRFRKFRENRLTGLKDQIHSIALLKDAIIPAAGIVKTLNCKTRSLVRMAEVTDFPYPYTHENPFPIFDPPLSLMVDSAFERLFTSASLFLTS